MTFAQAVAYFFHEACVSLVRSFKVSILAVLTIGVSLFLGGVFLLVSGSLSQVIESWRTESKLVVYLDAESSAEERIDLAARLQEAPWADGVEAVSTEEARRRFREAFPSLEDLLEGWGRGASPGPPLR